MRRFLPFFLALLLILSLLAGCGATDATADDGAVQDEVMEEVVQGGAKNVEESAEPVVSVDPSSTVLPDLEQFLRSRPYEGRPIEYVSGAYQLNFVWLPYAALEDVTAEVLALLAQPQYQLSLREMKETAYYGWTVYSYYFDYTGSGEGVTEIPNKYDEACTAPVIFMVADDKPEGCFHLNLFYSPAFELQDPGSRTSRNLTENGQGEIITEDTDLGEYEQDTSSDTWREKCSSCHGSGRCTRCNGTDEVEKFQAGLGWVEQNCTSCTGGRCRSCGGDGWK